MNLQKGIFILNSYQVSSTDNSLVSRIDTRALMTITVIFIFFILILPLENPERVIWFAIYPIIMSPLSNQTYSSVFRKSLIVLPFILFIGIFNPIYDKRLAFDVMNVGISYGWLSFFTILVRGLLATQSIIILIKTSGFINICNALASLHFLKVFTTQLLLLYRYLGLLLEEASNIHHAIISRGYGKKSFPIKMWANITGSLLIRTFERSKRIHNAMLARGFDGTIPLGVYLRWTNKDTLFCLIWLSIFFILYFI